MNDDDEIAEGGEMHEHNGREYSVVGNDVYVKGLFGWKLVEDEDEEAEAGDWRERSGSTYSLVGDKVYRRNWLNGWDEVEDDEERAEAGDIDEVNNKEYSRVGNTVYRKDLFGWTKVDDMEEEAEAGDIREVNNSTYSLVGDTVYRKDLFGWVEVEDDDECAEAGDIYKRNNTKYSRVGDTVYRKELFGWTKLTAQDDDEEYIESGSGSSSGSSSYSNYDDNDYSYSDSSSSNGGSTSDSGSLLGGILLVVVIIAAILFWLANRSGSDTPAAYQAPVVNTAPAPQPEQQAAVNPYGQGNGQVSFYRTCTFCKVVVLKDADTVGLLPTPGLLVHPECSDPYMLPVVYPAGDYTFNFRDDEGHTWQQAVQVIDGECVVVKVERPEAAADPAPDSVATGNVNPNTSAGTGTDLRLLAPEDHASFDYPRNTQVEWTAVAQADNYEVELQLSDAPYDYTATSFSPMPYSNGGIYTTTGTTLTIQGMGKQVHRLRVKALRNNVLISQTDWRYISYSN